MLSHQRRFFGAKHYGVVQSYHKIEDTLTRFDNFKELYEFTLTADSDEVNRSWRIIYYFLLGIRNIHSKHSS